MLIRRVARHSQRAYGNRVNTLQTIIYDNDLRKDSVKKNFLKHLLKNICVSNVISSTQ